MPASVLVVVLAIVAAWRGG